MADGHSPGGFETSVLSIVCRDGGLAAVAWLEEFNDANNRETEDSELDGQ